MQRFLIFIIIILFSLSASAQSLRVINTNLIEVGSVNPTNYHNSRPVTMNEYTRNSNIRQMCMINSVFDLKNGELLPFVDEEITRNSNDLYSIYRFSIKRWGGTFTIAIHCNDKDFHRPSFEEINQHLKGLISIE